MQRRSFLGAATLGVAASRLPAGLTRPWPGAGFRPPARAFLDALPRLLEVAAVPGVSFGVLSGGRASFYAAGRRLAGADDEVLSGTVFEAASLSKPVFAYLVLLLVQEGRLDLDQPLDRYLGTAYAPDDPRAAGITARNVLSHSSGYQNWRNNAQQKLATAFAPGEQFQYSGEGYYELQRAVETVTGRGIAALAEERVLGPLGMTSSSYLWREEFSDRYARGHRRNGAPAQPFAVEAGRELRRQAAAGGRSADDYSGDQVAAAFQAMSPPRPSLPVFLFPNVAGSLLTTAEDYLRFVQAMVGARPGPLEPRQLDAMATRQVDLRGPLAWGLGWGLEQDPDGLRLWHWGDNPGFKNFVIVDRRARQGVVVFTNGDNGRVVYERVVRACGGEDPAAFSWL